MRSGSLTKKAVSYFLYTAVSRLAHNPSKGYNPYDVTKKCYGEDVLCYKETQHVYFLRYIVPFTLINFDTLDTS